MVRRPAAVAVEVASMGRVRAKTLKADKRKAEQPVAVVISIRAKDVEER